MVKLDEYTILKVLLAFGQSVIKPFKHSTERVITEHNVLRCQIILNYSYGMLVIAVCGTHSRQGKLGKTYLWLTLTEFPSVDPFPREVVAPNVNTNKTIIKWPNLIPQSPDDGFNEDNFMTQRNIFFQGIKRKWLQWRYVPQGIFLTDNNFPTSVHSQLSKFLPFYEKENSNIYIFIAQTNLTQT